MYRPNSIDQERVSWRTVIYFNVVHSLKHILNTLETWDDCLEEDMDKPDDAAMDWYRSVVGDIPAASSSSTTTRPVDPAYHPVNLSRMTIGNIRRRLSPLIASDTALADRLSGGITVSGSGKGGVFVRSGWQARTIENALGKLRPGRNSFDDPRKSPLNGGDTVQDPLAQDVGRMLEASKSDVKLLWSHPTVQGLMVKRRLKLDEWSEL